MRPLNPAWCCLLRQSKHSKRCPHPACDPNGRAQHDPPALRTASLIASRQCAELIAVSFSRQRQLAIQKPRRQSRTALVSSPQSRTAPTSQALPRNTTVHRYQNWASIWSGPLEPDRIKVLI
jgi:hypothetical protein